jgi:hypothetical protein
MSSYIFKNSIRFLIVFCTLTFIFSNTVAILGGTCYSSPCTDLNESSMEGGISDSHGEYSYHFFLAPTTLLIPVTISKIDDFAIRDSKYFLGLGWAQFDRKNDNNKPSNEIMTEDRSSLLLAFLAIKLITLASLPWWLLIGWGLLKLGRAMPKLGLVILGLYILFFAGLKGLVLYFTESSYYSVFFKLLLG